MAHEIHKVVCFEKVAPFTLRVHFEDGTKQVIDFRPILAGELYGPLADPKVFDQVGIDQEVHTLTWANGADFDPALLHDWHKHKAAFEKLAKGWASISA